MTMPQSYRSQIATQAASLSILPFWYPLFAKSIYERAEILKSTSPGDLSHSNFFNNKRNYYRGITASFSMQPLFPLTDLILSTLLKKIQHVKQRDPNVGERISAGFITGASTVIIVNPYEVTVIAAQKHRESPYNALKKDLKHSGIRGLYTGSFPMAIRNGTFVSSLLVTTPVLQKKIDHQILGSGKAHDVATMILASTIPASIYTLVAVPLDFMAIMRQSDPSRKVHLSAFQALQAAYQKHGIAAFKAGLRNRLLASVIEMTGFNLFKQFYLEKL